MSEPTPQPAAPVATTQHRPLWHLVSVAAGGLVIGLALGITASGSHKAAEKAPSVVDTSSCRAAFSTAEDIIGSAGEALGSAGDIFSSLHSGDSVSALADVSAAQATMNSLTNKLNSTQDQYIADKLSCLSGGKLGE